jgi:hypothetical protein
MAGEITNLIISVLLIGAFITGITMFYGDVTNNYNVTAQNIDGISQSNTFINTSKNLAATVKENTDESNENQALGITGYLAPIQLIIDSIGAIGSLIVGGIEIIDLYIPIAWVEEYLVAIVTIIIVLGLLGVLLKREI